MVQRTALDLARVLTWSPMRLDGAMLGQDADGDSSQSSDEHMETGSEVRRRYLTISQSEVSGPDLWVLLNYGEDSESEEKNND